MLRLKACTEEVREKTRLKLKQKMIKSKVTLEDEKLRVNMKTNPYKFKQIYFCYIPDVIYSECIYTIECHKESTKIIIIFNEHVVKISFPLN